MRGANSRFFLVLGFFSIFNLFILNFFTIILGSVRSGQVRSDTYFATKGSILVCRCVHDNMLFNIIL